MKCNYKRILTSMLLMASIPAGAQMTTAQQPAAAQLNQGNPAGVAAQGNPSSQADSAGGGNLQTVTQDTSNLGKYLLNLGLYLGGWDLTTKPATTPSQAGGLLAFQTVLAAQTFLLSSMLQSIPASASTQFVPEGSSTGSGGGGGGSASFDINTLINNTFTSPNTTYNSAQGSQGVSASPLIDQPTFQADPVSQSILNILSTPSYSFCMNNNGQGWGNIPCTPQGAQGGSPQLTNFAVMENVIGPNIPSTQVFASTTYNQLFVNQLNSNSLLAPLLYATNSSSSTSPLDMSGIGSTYANVQKAGGPLMAQTQAQEAANFVRYAIAAVTPPLLPQYYDYDQMYIKATGKGNVSQNDQLMAAGAITNYLTNLRVYAAQTSVGISNLYYIMSKRMPQTPSTTMTNSNPSTGSNQTPTSQALSEYNMATWRLYDPTPISSGSQSTGSAPSGAPNGQWLTMINQASSDTVQKEMVTLLAEINYQLYLNRQQEERILLTNSTILLLNLRTAVPNAANLLNKQNLVNTP